MNPASSFALSVASQTPVQEMPFGTALGGELPQLVAGDTQGRSLRLGPPNKVTITNYQQPEIILGAPPMHVAWATPMNASTPVELNVTGAPDGNRRAICRFGAAVSLLAAGSRSGHSYHVFLLAEALACAGRPTDGLAALREAMAFVAETGERHLESALLRLQGALVLQTDGGSGRTGAARDATACFRRAIEVARRQRARTLEVRAALSLARLRDGRGQRGRIARAALAEALRRLPKGAGAPEVEEARALLAGTGSPPRSRAAGAAPSERKLNDRIRCG